MADIGGKYSSNRGYYPHFDYNVSYTQTGRNGTSASYRFTVSYSRLNGSYGYDIRINWNINGASGSKELKSTANNSSGSTTFDVTVSTDGNGGVINGCRIYSNSNTDGTHYQNGFDTGNRSVNKSTWNTAPTWTSDDGNINGIKSSSIISETTGSVTVNSPSVTDKENTVYLYVYRYVNGVQNAKIADGITGRSVTDNLSSFGQGTQIKYLFQAKDGYNLWAGDRWSWTYTKNVLTAANISVNKTITYADSNFVVSLSGASNSDGSGGFNYKLSCNNIPIHNSYGSATSWTVTIYKGGATPSGAYIKFEDLKNAFRGNSYTGRFTLDVSTSNSRGTAKTNSISVNVDLRTAPNNATISSIGGGVTVAGGSYYVPSLSALTVNWSAGSDNLGGAVTYDVQAAKSGQSYVNVATGLTGLSCTYNPGTVGSATNFNFRVITRTNFGYTNTVTSSTVVLHYYNAPRVSLGEMNRSATEVTLPVTTTTDTSIPAVAISSRKYTGKSGTATAFAGSPYTIKETGLTDTQTYNIRIDVSDNSGLGGSTVTVNKTVGTYVPIVSIRKYGLGVNAFANSTYKLKIGGSVYASGVLRAKNIETFEDLGANVQLNDLNRVGEYAQNSNANTSAALNYPENQAGHLTVTTGAGYQQRYHIYNTDKIYTRAQYGSGGWTPWSRLVTTKGDSAIAGNVTVNGKTASHMFTIVDGMNDLVDESPWYGLGRSNQNLGGGSSKAMQVAGYFGLRLRSSGSVLDMRHNAEPEFNTGVFFNGWVRAKGQNGLYFQDYGGGWHMIDDYWIRAYNGKNIYTSGEIQARRGFVLENSNDFKSYDIFRYGCRARFGMGADDSSNAYPTIEAWSSTSPSYRSRYDFKFDVFQFTHGNVWGKIWTNASGHGGISIGDGNAAYLKWLRSHTDIQFRNYSDSAFTRAIASAFVVSSKEKYKVGIKEPVGLDFNSIVMNNNIMEYQLIEEIDNLKVVQKEAEEKEYVLDDELLTPDTKLGLIIEELTEDVKPILNPSRTEGIDLYAMVSILWKHNQEQQKAIEELQEKVRNLTNNK